MKIILTTLLSLLFTIQVFSQAIDPYQPDASIPRTIEGMKLVWNDEFNVDGKPSSANWKYENGFVRNEELQYYRSDNVNSVGGVCLFIGKRDTVINAKYVSGSTDWRYKNQYAYWTSGSIITQGLKTFQYGQFEIRARIDSTVGSWPAIWTKGISGSWPYCGETDIMEFYIKSGVKTILANVAWGHASNPSGTWNTKTKTLNYFLGKDPNWCDKFHVWKEVWNVDTLKLYLDDELLNTQLLANTNNPLGVGPVNPHRQPHFLLLNLAIGANGGKPRASTSGYKYEVDYIRVYQVDPTATELIKDNSNLYFSQMDNTLKIQSDDSAKKLIVTDIIGRVVFSLENPEKSVSLEHFKPGIYITRLSMKNGQQYIQKIKKQ